MNLFKRTNGFYYLKYQSNGKECRVSTKWKWKAEQINRDNYTIAKTIFVL